MVGAAGALSPQYVDFKESARRDMQEIKAKMGELRKLHGQVLHFSLAHRTAARNRREIPGADTGLSSGLPSGQRNERGCASTTLAMCRRR